MTVVSVLAIVSVLLSKGHVVKIVHVISIFSIRQNVTLHNGATSYLKLMMSATNTIATIAAR